MIIIDASPRGRATREEEGRGRDPSRDARRVGRAAIDNLLYANDSGASPQVRIKKRTGGKRRRQLFGIVSSADRKRVRPQAIFASRKKSERKVARTRLVRCAHAHAALDVAASAYRTVIKKEPPSGTADVRSNRSKTVVAAPSHSRTREPRTIILRTSRA